MAIVNSVPDFYGLYKQKTFPIPVLISNSMEQLISPSTRLL